MDRITALRRRARATPSVGLGSRAESSWERGNAVLELGHQLNVFRNAPRWAASQSLTSFGAAGDFPAAFSEILFLAAGFSTAVG